MNEKNNTVPIGQRRGFGWASLALAILVLVPVGIYGLAGEGDRWQAALLLEKYLDGDKQNAIDSMREIVNRQPDNRQLRLILAQWLLDNDKASEALDLVEPMFESAQDAKVAKLYLDCLQANSQAKKALEAFREIHPASIVRENEYLLLHLNSLAYLQALAGEELDNAMRNSNIVVSEVSHSWNASVKDEMPPGLQVALTSVLLYRGSSGSDSHGNDIRTREYQSEIMAILDPVIVSLSESVTTGEAEKAENLEVVKSSFASLLTARALVLQDLGEQDRSFADRRRVEELGYDATNIASHWPVIIDCYLHLRNLAMFMDTRGCVFYKTGNSKLAISDLNAAVMAQEAICKAGPRVAAWHEFQTADLRELNTEINKRWNRDLAVLLYHRSWINKGLALTFHFENNSMAMQSALFLESADLQRVRELGFKPGVGLF